jgi:putative MFS transporter
VLIVISSVWYLSSTGITEQQFHWLAFFMGLAVGYWATFVTIASEQFGTNLRATVTTTAPNFVRGALIPSTFLFEFFVHRFGIIAAGYIMVLILSAIAVFALTRLKESFNKDLDYLEH